MIKGAPIISMLWDFRIKVVLYHKKCFFVAISAEILQICQATSSVIQFIETSKVFLHWMLRQGADPLSVTKVLVKMINHHVL